MISQSEPKMHRVRWLLTVGWLLLICSLFYDPISPWLTEPHNTLSPFRVDPICVAVQGVCLEEKPYPIGARIFWAAVVPCSIFILLVFGHELWRRICPLSFLSQIPRALGIQRRYKRVNTETGKINYELAKVKPNSWLDRNYLYLQFGLFYLGLCIRLLFVNTTGWVLGSFLLFTIALAIAVGYLYDGKSWCNYFCPMSPVQKIYSEPRGLLTSTAHQSPNPAVTQSMCRTVDPEGKEQSACVACQTPCIDIDAEKSYWDSINQPDRKLLYYGYIGLVFSFYIYYYLYAGNFDYYFSGSWTHEENLLDTLFNPGFYLFDTPIPIPKLVAVPLTLGLFGLGSYWLGLKLEKYYKAYLWRKKQILSSELVQHRMFTLYTFLAFNLFYVFGGRPTLKLLPKPLQYLFNASIVLVSTLWLYRTWGRSSEQYNKESLAHKLRRQLKKLSLDFSQFLKGRSLNDLNSDELYILATVLPGATQQDRYRVYKEILQEALVEKLFEPNMSKETLQQLRQKLQLTDEEHDRILAKIIQEQPHLLDLVTSQNTKRGLIKTKLKVRTDSNIQLGIKSVSKKHLRQAFTKIKPPRDKR